MTQLSIKRQDLDAIVQHAQETYPNECCGLLTGAIGAQREVRGVHRGRNIAADPRDRYELDPYDHFQIRKFCYQQNQEVIGFYHSHPDYPAQPSQMDADRAWSDYSYLIVSVVQGAVYKVTSWIFNGDLRKFEEESIIIQEPGGVQER